MPIHYYPPIDEVVTETASLKSFTGTCSSPGSSSTTQTVNNVKSIRREHATGWRIPGWNKMRNSGIILPFTQWDKFHLNVTAQLGQREWCASPTSNRNRWDNLYRGGSNLDLSSSYLRDLANPDNLDYYVQKAASSIYSSGFDALTFLAEARQLRRMFSGVVTKFRGLTDRKNLTLKKASDYWLEGRYGWRTLLYDVTDFHQALETANERRTRYRQATGSQISGSNTSYSESTTTGITTGVSTEISWSGSVRGTVVADIEVPGFTFNPVTSAWELTRLSFVVDWLLNVGQALEAASFLLLAKSYQAGWGYKIDFNLNCNFTHVGTTGTTVVHANHGSSSGTAQLVARRPSTVSTIPRVRLRLDEFKAIDLLALAWQQLSKRR